MVVSEQIISVLDYACEKLGIAIDWTSENIMPKVVEFMERYQSYAIVEHGIHIIMFMILVAFIGVFLKVMYKGIKTKNHDNIWYDMSWSTGGIAPTIITVVLLVGVGFTIAEIVEHVFEIAKWALVPEIQFVETFSGYLKSVS